MQGAGQATKNSKALNKLALYPMQTENVLVCRGKTSCCRWCTTKTPITAADLLNDRVLCHSLPRRSGNWTNRTIGTPKRSWLSDQVWITTCVARAMLLPWAQSILFYRRLRRTSRFVAHVEAIRLRIFVLQSGLELFLPSVPLRYIRLRLWFQWW